MKKCPECDEEMETTCEYCGKLICSECDYFIQSNLLEVYACAGHNIEVICRDGNKILKKKS